MQIFRNRLRRMISFIGKYAFPVFLLYSFAMHWKGRTFREGLKSAGLELAGFFGVFVFGLLLISIVYLFFIGDEAADPIWKRGGRLIACLLVAALFFVGLAHFRG
jgi:hypothetical protein